MTPLPLRSAVTAAALCSAGPAMADPAAAPPAVTAHRVDAPPTLDDPVWDRLPRHALGLDAGAAAAGRSLLEPGCFQLAFDDEAIYLRTDFTDRDPFTLATADGQRLYTAGDLAEWFIGPPPDPQGRMTPYLELHAAPNGVRSAYLLRRPGLPEPLSPAPFEAEVSVDPPGTPGRGWRVLFSLPRAELFERIPGLDAAGEPALSLLVARYDYSAGAPYAADGGAGPELSCWPVQPRTAFHLRPFHAPVRFGGAD